MTVHLAGSGADPSGPLNSSLQLKTHSLLLSFDSDGDAEEGAFRGEPCKQIRTRISAPNNTGFTNNLSRSAQLSCPLNFSKN
jgi:hypothetical protein